MRPGQQVKIEESGKIVEVHKVDVDGNPTHYIDGEVIKEVINETLTSIAVNAIKRFGKWLWRSITKRDNK